MKPLPELVVGKLLLSLGDSVFVPAKVLQNSPDGRTWGTEVPYLHFRKSPVKSGLYVVSDIWMHPKATDPSTASSYCYTLVKVREDRTWTNDWRSRRTLQSSFTPEDLSTTKLPYNCLDWDILIKEGKVKTDVYKPGERFNLDEFKKDLGQVLYKHKASLSICREYDGPWDEDGTTVLRVVVNGENKGTLATKHMDFPVRRSEPTWDGGKPNRGPSVSTLVSAEQN